MIETIARQPWVLHHKVGMMGISYGGISQLFTAQTNPPSLAAISPLSVLDATQTTLYPGGILNTGFALNWAKERVHDAQPAGPSTGQPWAYQKIQDGDQICKANQALHGEAANLLDKVRANNHYVPTVADPLAPITFVNKIHVPVYMACQWTDEQTGGHCPTLAEHFTGTQRKWFTFTNGTHVDSLDPETFNRWYDFLELYVARQAPITKSAAIHAAAPVIYQEAMGIPGVTMPPDPIQTQPTYAGAKAAFEQLKPIRVLFDNGAGGSQPGQPQPGFEQSFSKFPIPNTSARYFYFSGGGVLGAKRPAHAGADSFDWNAHARPLTDFTGDTAAGTNGLWTATPPYHWVRPPAGSAASYVTNPLSQNATVIGAGAVHAWVRSSTPQRRPPGHGHRGPPRRQGDLRAERLGAGQRAQARRSEEHPARARPEPPGLRRVAAAERPLCAGHDPALLRGAHLPRRLANPGDDHRPERRPAHLVVRRDPAEGARDGFDRPLAEHAVESHPSGGVGRERADRAAAVPRPQGRTVPGLPALREPANDSLTARPGQARPDGRAVDRRTAPHG